MSTTYNTSSNDGTKSGPEPRLRAPLHPEEYLGTSPIAQKRAVKNLGHLVYQVSDIERSVRFWTEVMGFRESDRNWLGMVFLRCNSDHHAIGLVPRPDYQRPDTEAGLHVQHLAFEVDSIDTLLAMREFLVANGIAIRFEGRKGAGCNCSINFLDPDGYEFEIYVDMDQIDESGRVRPPDQFRPAEPLSEAVKLPVAPWK